MQNHTALKRQYRRIFSWPWIGKDFLKQVTKGTNDKGKGSNKKEQTTSKLRTLFTKDIKRMERQATGVEDKLFATNK